jgi:hypothetical protein
VIPGEQQRPCIQLPADYELRVGQLSRHTGVWPDENALQLFAEFCAGQYALTMDLMESHSDGSDQ